MHELSIARNIIDILQQEQVRHGFAAVRQIHLALGPLSNVVPESLLFCFDAIKDGTLAAEAVMDIRSTPMTAECRSCLSREEFHSIDTICSTCGSHDMEVLSGADLSIVSIDVDEPPVVDETAPQPTGHPGM